MAKKYRYVYGRNTENQGSIVEKEMKENKHEALLNNCVDDDRAILHKREIKKIKKGGD